MSAPMVPFGKIARSMRNGLSPARGGSVEGEVLTLSAVTQGQFNPAHRKQATFESYPGDGQTTRAGMFLMCRGNGNLGLVGSGVVVPLGAPSLVFPDTVIGAVLDLALVDPAYLVRAWATPGVRAQIEAGARTTNGTFKINQQVLEGIQLLLPSLPEQRRIAALLDEADVLRRKRRESLALLDELVKSAFFEMFGDPVTNPRGWTELELGAGVLDGFRNGLSPASGGTVQGQVLTLSAVTGSAFDPAHRKQAVFDRAPDPSQLVREGLFLMCRGNGNIALVGRGHFAERSPVGIVFPDTVIACEPDPRAFDAHYFAAAWRTASVRMQLEAGARTTNGTYKVNQQVLSKVRLLAPPLREQRKYAEVAVATTAQRCSAEASMAALDTLFASLLDRAFSGQL